MTATVFGELTSDGHIVVMADGPIEDQAIAARYLQTLTPLIETLCGCGHVARQHHKSEGPCGCGCPGLRTAALQMPATWAALVQLAGTYGQWWRPGPRLVAWAGERLAARTAERGELTVAPPAGLTPRPYQVEGARLIGSVGSGLLFDDQGTGKTVTAILGVRELLAARRPVLPVVVVCPSAVVDSWIEHVHTWAPELRAVPWRGTPGRRKRRIGTADVYVASYGTAARDAATFDRRKIAAGKAPLMTLGPRLVIADEVHKIKASTSTYSVAVRNLADLADQLGGGFVGLSGTPITHSPKDLWPALFAVCPRAFPASERWVSRYCDTIPGDYTSTVLGLNTRAEPEFRDTILGQYRRVSKADVLKHLPPKVYSIRRVELPAEFRKAYDAVESEMLAELPEGGGELSPMTVLTQMSGLMALANAAADVFTWYETVQDPTTGLEVEKRHQEITLKAPSWKVDEALDVMAERPGQQFIAAAPSRQLVEIMGEVAKAKGYRVAYVVGGQTPRERSDQVAAFQRGEFDLMCVTTGAGGVGLTLTAASCLIFLQRPWSIVEALQMEDRCHRIGSEVHDSIEIVDIVAEKTVETRVRALLKDKAQQLSDVVQDPRIVAELLGGAGVRDLRRKKAA